MPKYKVNLMYNSMYTKCIQFPLGVMLMDYNMVERISKRTTRAIIGAMGINRSSPRILAFLPPKLLGLGLKHHYLVQGTSHVKQIVQHLRQQDDNGKLYKMIFEFAQLLAGVPYPILQYPTTELPHISEPLIVEVRKFLVRCGMNIAIPDIYKPGPLRENDINIMSTFLKTEKKKSWIRRANQCRLFLQVTWLSEICNIKGVKILPTYLVHDSNNPEQSFSTLRWPFQELPPKQSVV